MAASVPLKTYGETVECARSELALRTKAFSSVTNVQISKTPRALVTKDCAKAAREGEKTLEKRFCESKLETLTIGSRSKTRSGAALIVVVECGGSKRPVFSAVSLLVDISRVGGCGFE